MIKLLRYVALPVLALVAMAGCTTYNVEVITKPAVQVDDRADANELHQELAMATVLVRTDSGTGSGVVVADGSLVLTAAHVVSHLEPEYDMDGNLKRNPDGSLIPKVVPEIPVVFKNLGITPFLSGAEVIKIDVEKDLAVLKLAVKWPYTSAKLAQSDPYLYQKCWISGHPHGVTDTYITEGRVQDLWDDGFVRYSAPTTFGNSGGPVFIREDGKYRLTSIVQRVHVEGMGVAVNHLGLGALPDVVREFLKEYIS